MRDGEDYSLIQGEVDELLVIEQCVIVWFMSCCQNHDESYPCDHCFMLLLINLFG
jgi:hypothetical protein